MYLLLLMNVILDFICMAFADLLGTGKEKNRNESLCLKRESNHRPVALQAGTLDRLATH